MTAIPLDRQAAAELPDPGPGCPLLGHLDGIGGLLTQLPRSGRRSGTEPARVLAGGTRLRIRALQAMGHSAARIGRAAGAGEQVIQRLARGDVSSVSRQLRNAVAEVYDAWWDKRPPDRTPGERTAAAAARHRAARGNWCAGAGLDDDLIDEPGYRPTAPWRPAAGTGTAADFCARVARERETRMSCDGRHTRELVTDVLEVLHQHGYRPGDPAHARRAERLIGDLACIYQGSQDAPSGAYVMVGPPPGISREAAPAASAGPGRHARLSEGEEK
jgi:hypothetical protein